MIITIIYLTRRISGIARNALQMHMHPSFSMCVLSALSPLPLKCERRNKNKHAEKKSVQKNWNILKIVYFFYFVLIRPEN